MAQFDPYSSLRERKLVVLGIPWDVETDELKYYMRKFGELEDCIVMKDRATGQSRGFGYVTFLSVEDAKKATAAQHFLNGRALDVKVATPREEMTTLGSRKGCRIFVARIPSEVTNEMFRSYFQKYGAIVDAYMPKDAGSKAHRGIGFVTFENPDSVDKIMNETHELGGSTIAIDRATPKDDTAKPWSKPFPDQYSLYNAYMAAAAAAAAAFGAGGTGDSTGGGFDFSAAGFVGASAENTDAGANNEGGAAKPADTGPTSGSVNEHGSNVLPSDDGAKRSPGAAYTSAQAFFVAAAAAAASAGYGHPGSVGYATEASQNSAPAYGSLGAQSYPTGNTGYGYGLPPNVQAGDVYGPGTPGYDKSASFNGASAGYGGSGSGAQYGNVSDSTQTTTTQSGAAAYVGSYANPADMGYGPNTSSSGDQLGYASGAGYGPYGDVRGLATPAGYNSSGSYSNAAAAPGSTDAYGFGNPYSGAAAGSTAAERYGLRGPPVPPVGNKIFIGKLPHEATAEHLRTYFSAFGRVLDVYIPKDAKKTGHRGFGFVTFFDDGVAERVAQEAHEILGQPIAVDRPTPHDGSAGGGPHTGSFGAPSSADVAGSGSCGYHPAAQRTSYDGGLNPYSSNTAGQSVSGDPSSAYRASRTDGRYRPY